MLLLALAWPAATAARREARERGGAAYSCSTGGADGSTGGDGPWASEASANIAVAEASAATTGSASKVG